MINNIKNVREACKLSREQLAQKIGIGPQAIYRLEQKTSGIDTTILFKLCLALNAKLADLISYDDELEFDAGALNDLADVYRAYRNNSLKLVPVLSWKEAVNYKKYGREGKRDFVVTHKVRGEHAYALTVDDKSMEPRFTEGDKIVADPDMAVAVGDYCVVTIDKVKAHLMLLVNQNESELCFATLVPNSGKMVLPANLKSSNVLGKVVDMEVQF